MSSVFSSHRERFWPIHRQELKKFLPLALIMFCVIFNYTIVRMLKDSFVVTAFPGKRGEEVISYIRIFFDLPMAVLLITAYAKLSNILTREQLYFSCLFPFIAFFLLFGFVLYPAKETLHISKTVLARWQKDWPAFEYFFPTIANWTYTLFYVMADLWGNIAVNILFWQFANQITYPEQAKRFYPMFGILAQFGLILGGLLSIYGKDLFHTQNFSSLLQIMTVITFILGIVMGITYWWMNKRVLTDGRHYDQAKLLKRGKEGRPHLSLKESFFYIAQSRYLWYIAILVLASGIVVNIMDVTWKGQIRDLYADEGSYNEFLGWLYVWLGIITLVTMIFAKGLVKRFGWTFSASVMPWLSLVFGALFFLAAIFKTQAVTLIGGALLHLDTPLLVIIAVGMIQEIFVRGAKYAVFDPTKEMAYIPLDEEMQVKGKAVVDVIGGRLAKSGGSVIRIILLSLFGCSWCWGLAGAEWAKNTLFYPCLLAILVVVCLLWIWAVKKLSVDYHQKIRAYNEDHHFEKKS